MFNFFKIKSISEAVFIIAILIAISTMIIMQHISFYKHYHHFVFKSDGDEMFIEKEKGKIFSIYKTIDSFNGYYPRVYYEVIENNESIKGSILLCPFELQSNMVIFEDVNGTFEYVDQCKE